MWRDIEDKKLLGFIGNEEYLKKAEDNMRNCLCLFYPDGGASCAYVYPYSVNGVRGEFFDDWANDQDFALYYYFKYNKEVN